MTTPDEAESKAYAAAGAISEQVGKLWLQAHADGIRNGMEASAVMLEGAMTWCRDNFVDPQVVDLLTHLRDQLRLCALQVPDPEVPHA